jgi:hypothetical protein
MTPASTGLWITSVSVIPSLSSVSGGLSGGSKPDRPPETEVRDGITDTDVIEQPQ